MTNTSSLPETTDIVPLQPFEYEELRRLNHVERPRAVRGDSIILITAAFLGGFIAGRLFR
jgi:hypothetical protein